MAENAHGFRDIPEALHLRDHVIRQIELADAADDPAERAARLTFVVVGADYTGTEVVAQIQLLTHDVLSRHPRLAGVKPRWLLLDTADHVLPGRDSRLAATAERVLRERGIEVDMGTSVAEATAAGVKLTDDRFVPSRTLVWCIGVRPDPLTQSTGLPLTRGRVQVDEYLAVPGHPEILACGDAARGARPVAASGGPCLEQWDGIEDPESGENKRFRIGDYRREAWFRPFRNATPRDGRAPSAGDGSHPSRGCRRTQAEPA